MGSWEGGFPSVLLLLSLRLLALMLNFTSLLLFWGGVLI